MRTDGQSSGGGIAVHTLAAPAISTRVALRAAQNRRRDRAKPRRRSGSATANGAAVTSSQQLSTGRSLCVVEERDTVMLSESAPTSPEEAWRFPRRPWRQTTGPNTPCCSAFPPSLLATASLRPGFVPRWRSTRRC
jgi:hypothetical protein